jgi:hypothetical protein
MNSIGSGIIVYCMPGTVFFLCGWFMGAAWQYLLSKPLEEVQIEMTNDSSFLSNESFRSGAKKNGEKIENVFPIKRKNPQPLSSG